MKPVRRTAAAAVVALAALVLTACSSPSAGTAVAVGSQTVSDAQVASMVDELRTQVAAIDGATFDEKASTLSTVDRLARHLLLLEAAQREGITVTQGEIDQLVQDSVTSQAGGDRSKLVAAFASQSSVPASEISSYAGDYLISRALGEKLVPGVTDSTQIAKANTAYVAKLAQEVGVEISPRFGTWDADTAELVAGPNDLSTTPPVAPGTGAGVPQPLPLPAGP